MIANGASETFPKRSVYEPLKGLFGLSIIGSDPPHLGGACHIRTRSHGGAGPAELDDEPGDLED